VRGARPARLPACGDHVGHASGLPCLPAWHGMASAVYHVMSCAALLMVTNPAFAFCSAAGR
jgi:hypothetical protein